MPKKPTPPAQLRWGTLTIAQLEETVATIALLTKRIEGSITAAKKLGLSDIRFDGITKGQRAIVQLKGMAANLEHACRRAEYREL